MCLQVQAQVQCTGALVHRCTGTVYQQVNLQVQCELYSVQGINTMYSVQCNVRTSTLAKPGGQGTVLGQSLD